MKQLAARSSSLVFALTGCFLGCTSTAIPPSQMPNGGNAGAPVAGAPVAGASNAGAPGGAANPGAGAAAAGSTAGSASNNGGSGGMNAAAGVSGMSTANGGAGQRGALVYVGSSNGQISIFELDAALGQLSLRKSVAAGNSPSFLAFDPALTHLYAVNEQDGKVAAFKVDAQTGDLTLLNRVDSGGAAPAHVTVDHSGKYVLVANYTGGTSRVFPIAADGSLGAPTDSKSPGKNSHQIIPDPANKFAFVANLGSDTVSQYAFDAAKGTLTPNSVPSVITAPGAGPRHLTFHPNGKFAFLINELNDTLSSYSYNASSGQLTHLQTLSTLPAGTDGSANSCAEVLVAPSGNFVYGSNRGHDSIVTFSVNPNTGMLGFIGTTPSGGKVPRNFTLSTDGKLMLVANESGNVVSFSVNVTSGALSALKTTSVPPKPQFVGIVHLPGGAR